MPMQLLEAYFGNIGPHAALSRFFVNPGKIKINKSYLN
jgi:hypothetical protein